MKNPIHSLTNPLEDASSRLPRLAFIVLLTCFIIPGLIGRYFWSSEELTVFSGILDLTNANRAIDVLCPRVLGDPLTQGAPLLVWLGSITAAIFGWAVGLDAASRLSVAAIYALGCMALWFTTWDLARRHEAQPVSLPFMKNIPSRDYARLMADATLLLAISTFGLFLPMRELTSGVLAFCLTAGFMMSVVWSLSQTAKSVFLTGVACALAAIGVDFWFGLILLLAGLVLHAKLNVYRVPFTHRAGFLVAGFLTILIWPILAFIADAQSAKEWFGAWFEYEMALYARSGFEDWLSKNVLWFAWPVWAYALWCLKVYFKIRARTHIRIALVTAVCIFIFGLAFATHPRIILIAMVPPLAVLAGFGVSSSPAAGRFLDRVSTVIASVVIIILWAVFIAWYAGWPEGVVALIDDFTANAGLHMHGMRLALAMIATLIWIFTILWRLGLAPVHFWKGPWLSAVGITCVAVIAVNLFTSAINANQSLYKAAQEMRRDFPALAGPSACYAPLGLNNVQKRMLTYWGLTFGDDRCAWRLTELDYLAKYDPERQLYEPVGKVYTRPDERRVYLFVIDKSL